MSVSQAERLSPVDLGQAFEMFRRVSSELDTSYRDLESKVAGLTAELGASRSERRAELAEKARILHRLGSLLSALPGGVLIVDAAGRIRDANPEALELLGEPLLSELWLTVLARVAGEDAAAGRDIQTVDGKRLSMVSRDLDTSGDRVVLITDTSELHQLEAQVARENRLSALGEMAARLAHQIRTPLSSTTLYLAQLERADLPQSQRENICNKLGERLGHMEGLIDSMLGFVRGDAPATDVICLREVLDGLAASVRPQLEQGGSALNLPQLDDSLLLVGERDELVGALSNLAMNAVEAADGAVEVTIWVGALSQEWLQLRVRDTGPGIDPAVIGRIFDPFFTTRSRGTGLGLAVVAKTVRNHGGQISAHNRPEGGAEFVINLPIARPQDGQLSDEGQHNVK